MDEQQTEVFVLIRQSEQHIVDHLTLIEKLKHSATDEVYAELKQITDSMEIPVLEPTNIWKLHINVHRMFEISIYLHSFKTPSCGVVPSMH